MRVIARLLAIGLLAVLAAGCGWLQAVNPARRGGPMLLDNPLLLPPMDREFLWNEVVDTVNDYFKIEREDRIRIIGGVASEGRIETYPETAATYLEPWRRDSTPGPERLQSTLQSIRRRAVVRLSPVAEGYLLNVAVLKELEDVERPEFSTIGGQSLRHDGSLVRTSPVVEGPAATLGWIPQGRDYSLEQQLLVEIQARLIEAGVVAAPAPAIPDQPLWNGPSQ